MERSVDVWEYYPTYSVDKSGKKVLIIRALASLSDLSKFDIQNYEQVRKLWFSVLSNISLLKKKTFDDSLFEVKIEGGTVEVRVTIPQDYIESSSTREGGES